MDSFFAILIGMIISVMISLNSVLEKNIGSSYSLLIIHMVGLVGIIILMISKKEKLQLKKNIPFYYYIGGLVGVLLTIINMTTINKIGVAVTTAFAILGQMIFSCFVDHFGLFGMEKYRFDKRKVVGFLIIAIGLGIMTL